MSITRRYTDLDGMDSFSFRSRVEASLLVVSQVIHKSRSSRPPVDACDSFEYILFQILDSEKGSRSILLTR